LFVIGNGTGNSTASRTDALVMLKNGNTVTNGIWSGTGFNILVTPNQKAKVKPLKSSINKLKKLNVYQYKIKQRSRKTQFGFNVEEMKRLFPNLVYESDSIKSIDYMGLIPVLLNALLELQQELNQIKKELK
ncbi:MAG: tail fiber domain-containing protein, partial [Flavobacteriaceae bacterium]